MLLMLSNVYFSALQLTYAENEWDGGGDTMSKSVCVFVCVRERWGGK